MKYSISDFISPFLFVSPWYSYKNKGNPGIKIFQSKKIILSLCDP
jgi:hypothetical protein